MLKFQIDRACFDGAEARQTLVLVSSNNCQRLQRILSYHQHWTKNSNIWGCLGEHSD